MGLKAIVMISLILLSVFSASENDPFEWIKNIFDKGLNAIEELGTYLIMKFVQFLLFIARLVYILVGVVGVILWFSGIQPHKGRRFVIGALFLAAATEILRIILA